MKASATFTLKSWDEKTWDGQGYTEVTGRKLTHTSVAYTYQGELAGESMLHYLMFYREDGSGASIGLEQVTGSLGGRSGSFVLQHHGAFTSDRVQGDFSIISGSGTGDLVGLRGAGILAVAGEPWSLTLDYDFE